MCHIPDLRGVAARVQRLLKPSRQIARIRLPPQITAPTKPPVIDPLNKCFATQWPQKQIRPETSALSQYPEIGHSLSSLQSTRV
jgi:hypothetical protein